MNISKAILITAIFFTAITGSYTKADSLTNNDIMAADNSKEDIKNRAIDIVHAAIRKNNLTSVPDICLSYEVDTDTLNEEFDFSNGTSDKGYYYISVRENKRYAVCGGDPNTEVRLFSFLINQKTHSLYLYTYIDGTFQKMEGIKTVPKPEISTSFISDLTGQWIGNKYDAQGKPVSELLLNLKQENDKITGTFCYIQYEKALKDCPSGEIKNLYGNVYKNNIAVTFKSSLDNKTGKADLIINKSSILWLLLSLPEDGEIFSPKTYNLNRKF